MNTPFVVPTDPAAVAFGADSEYLAIALFVIDSNNLGITIKHIRAFHQTASNSDEQEFKTLLAQYASTILHGGEGDRARIKIMLGLSSAPQVGARSIAMARDNSADQKKGNSCLIRVLSTLIHGTTATTNAWQTPYIGIWDDLLIRELKRLVSEGTSNSAPPYGNILPIVQSSGTGKSRLVHEASGKIFAFPVNLRSSDETGTTYPAPDDEIRDYLTYYPKEKWLFKHAHRRSQALLVAFFRCAEEALRQPHFSRRYRLMTDLALSWRDYLGAADDDGGQRNAFYAQAVVLARSLESGLPDTNLVKAAGNAADALLSQIRSKLDPSEANSKKEDIILLYFDEAHTLISPTSDGPKTLLDALTKSIDDVLKHRVVAVFMSTNSHLAAVAVKKSEHPSTRVTDTRLPLPAPYTELPFDCDWNKEPIVKEGVTLMLRDVQSLNHLVKYGRPLWYTRWNGKVTSIQPQMIEFAQLKLMGPREKWTDGTTQEGILAALDVRLSLDFETSRDVGRTMARTLVEQHMRIAYSVPQHREYLRSGYPSEPILAEAAARTIAEHLQLHSRETIVSTLQRWDGLGVLDKGAAGELAARVILTSAYDAAIAKASTDGTPFFSKGCSLIDFLKALYGQDNWEKIRNSPPNNVSDKTPLERAFGNSWVRFTHFGRGKDSSVVSPTLAWVAFLRCMAIQCEFHQVWIDLIIPVVHNKDRPLRPGNMSSMLVSIKNRPDAISSTRIEFEERDLSFFPKTRENDNRPYIAVLMQLGAGAGELQTVGGPAIIRSGKKHPRYTLNALGCSPKLYPVVTSSEEYAALLKSRTMISEHGRKDTNYQQMLERQKPYWSRDSLHFVGNIESFEDEPEEKTPSPPVEPDYLRKRKRPASTGF